MKNNEYRPSITEWLPTTAKEVKKRGWEQLDVILVSGDAYVDHPSFGHAVIGRLLEKLGLKVGIIAQPNWKDDLRDFKKLGAPRLFFGVTAGCMDSMVNHYTANKRLRSDDAYTPGGNAGFRPDYPTVEYTKILKDIFPDTPVVLGGIEASLRRVTHYDYWQDKLLPSVLSQSGADLLIYGMGEKPITELVKLLSRGVPFESLKTIPQTSYIHSDGELRKNKKWEDFELNSHDECLISKESFASNFKMVEEESNTLSTKRLLQRVGGETLVINPPYPQMSTKEIDNSFDLPYTRLPHPKYSKRGAIPGYEMIKHSVNVHRGCFGGCSFCTISAHQGKHIASRSPKSIIGEIKNIAKLPDFKGVLTDLGGPSANMYQMKGINLDICDKCRKPSCIFPKVCSNLDRSHHKLLELYREVDKMPEVKHCFISSGVRYDMLAGSEEEQKKLGLRKYKEKVIRDHVSGRFKVAPEHTSDEVLNTMRKPSFKLFKEFKREFEQLSKKFGKKQEVIPYFISSHPACKLEDMANLASETKALGYKLKQVQDFTPTPMTLSTVMFYSGIDPYKMKPVFTAKEKKDKLDQRRFFFWYKEENFYWVNDFISKFKG